VYGDDSPLLGLENAVCLPHVGAYTFESVENMGIVSAENCVSVLEGREPQFRVTRGG
jgi:phosphoglycerate dehydrogenase-like enzyme